MSHFLRLLGEDDKSEALLTSCRILRQGGKDHKNFEIAPESFDAIPGKPFAYWVSDEVRGIFKRLPRFEGDGRTVRVGLQTSDDFRFLRDWWEVDGDEITPKWRPFAKGGAFSPFYADVHLSINWMDDAAELIAFPLCVIRNPDYYFRPGITWPLRAHRFSPQLMPAGCIFSVRGYSAFPAEGCELETLALFSSTAFDYIFKTALGRFGYPEFIVGVLQMLPWAEPTKGNAEAMQKLAKRAWSLKRSLDTVNETSHAFLLPLAVRDRVGAFDAGSIESELEDIQAAIDSISFDLYGFSEVDRLTAMGQGASDQGSDDSIVDDDSEDDEAEAPPIDALLSWAVGVIFGRFDWRLAIGERLAPAEPEPFDPLPAKSPGMLPEGVIPFHQHSGILVDDQGHQHDLDDEKQFEALQSFEQELIELRDTLLKLAPTYKPNQDDGVQISAAPLWPLFRHKPWQKLLKDTWIKLEKGNYDWANLAMNYWPDRVREKCRADKSLAIAHGLEPLFVESIEASGSVTT